MTYEQIEKKLKNLKFMGYSYYGPKPEMLLFSTLTLFHGKSGYKLALRMTGSQNFSSEYEKTLDGAFNSLMDQVNERKEVLKKRGVDVEAE